MPRVAWNSVQDEYLVVWNAFNTASSFPPGVPNDIAGARVQPDGSFWPTPILTTYASPYHADLVYNPAMDEYLLTFVAVHTQGTTGNDIYGLRVGANGYPINPPGLIPICELDRDQDVPAVATNEQDRYMVVWQHEYTTTDRDIYAREYDALGNPVGSYFTIASWTEDTTAPDVAANGASREWLVVWQEALGGRGFRQGSAGAAWGSTRAISAWPFLPTGEQNPAAAAVPDLLITYGRFFDDRAHRGWVVAGVIFDDSAHVLSRAAAGPVRARPDGRARRSAVGGRWAPRAVQGRTRRRLARTGR
jgi:hypothetical protein